MELLNRETGRRRGRVFVLHIGRQGLNGNRHTNRNREIQEEYACVRVCMREKKTKGEKYVKTRIEKRQRAKNRHSY